VVRSHLARALVFRRRAGGGAGLCTARRENNERGSENGEFSDGEIAEHGFLRLVLNNQKRNVSCPDGSARRLRYVALLLMQIMIPTVARHNSETTAAKKISTLR
jgi:hypothetical protein